MDKELEELEKTTEYLKSFKSHINLEDKTEDIDELISAWKSNNKLNDVDDKTLVISEEKNDKNLVLDTVETLDVMSVEVNHNVYNELENSLNKRKIMKKIGMIIILVSILLIPILVTCIIIGNHSNELISSNLKNIFMYITGILSILVMVGLILVIRNIHIKVNIKVSAILKYIYTFFMVFYITFCITFLVLLYGINDFKDWIITNAMNTSTLKTYCKWFYSQEEIDEVLVRTSGKEKEELTNNDNKDNDDFEKIILDRDEDTLYKVIQFDVNDCKAYLAIIYDASKVSVVTTSKVGTNGEYVTDMSKRKNAVVAINGAGSSDTLGAKPMGITISNSKIITNNEYGKYDSGGLIGITKENKLVLLNDVTADAAIKLGVRDAVSWGPFLLVDGNVSYIPSDSGLRYAARTAIGQRADGIMLLLVIDSNYNRTKGANLQDVTNIMQRYGAINAASLDGDVSSVMAINSELISHPIDTVLQNKTKTVATSFIVTN